MGATRSSICQVKLKAEGKLSAGQGLMQEYVHHELNQEISAIAGHYVLVKEVRLSFSGRQILYLVGHAAFDSTCCSVGGCAYALVVGFVLHWKTGRNRDGLAVSLMEPIRAEAIRANVRRLIEKNETVQQIIFR
jgi:hypothetical protein